MEQLQAGIAALGVIGPALGVGIATAAAASAIGRNPEAAEQSAASSSSVQRSQKASAFLRSCSASSHSFSNSR